MRSLLALLLAVACPGAPPPVDSGDSGPRTDSAETGTPPEPTTWPQRVRVELDGVPVAGAVVVQGGVNRHWTTGGDGEVEVQVDGSFWQVALHASHPDARIRAALVSDPVELVLLELTSFDRRDNPLYAFQHPGTPEISHTSAFCAHCHVTITADWYASPHATAASNPVVHDVYAGAAAALADEATCVAAGGRWWTGIGPGTAAPSDRCYLGDGALPALNAECGDTAPCDGVATHTGACADCHAPGIDGVLGGRDLLEATGIAFDYGVHCDVCHKVEDVDLAAPAGVAGRLVIQRPSEPGDGVLFDWSPLTFGPWHDVANPRMGAVARDVYLESRLCAGCHQHDQAFAPAGAAIDTTRWPSGAIPVHSTFAEWEAGPMNPAAPCQSCHMPPDPDVANGNDLQLLVGTEGGIAGGWERPAGTVRHHQWLGPRTPDAGMLELAAALFVDSTVEGGTLTTRVTTKNVAAGHAIPTGEPLRSMVLTVEARCGTDPLSATGGDAVWDAGGVLDQQDASGDWSTWPGARAGEVIRVVSRPGTWHDYEGFGPFGDGRFDPVARGLPVEHVVGEATIVAMTGDAVSLDRPLPPGDVAYRGDADALAGSPGFAFARVTVAPDGRRHVPHGVAVDVASDNRLLPQQSFTTTHSFATPCATPTVHATLRWRRWPVALARERGWGLQQRVMAEVTR